MSEIVQNLSSVSWWFSVVFVGIIVSIIGTYAKSATEYAARYALDKLAMHKRKGEESTKKVIEKLNYDDDFRDFIFQGEMRTYMASFAYFASAVSALCIYFLMVSLPELSSIRHLSICLGIFSAICFYLSGSKFLSGAYLGYGLILAAKERFKLE